EPRRVIGGGRDTEARPETSRVVREFGRALGQRPLGAGDPSGKTDGKAQNAGETLFGFEPPSLRSWLELRNSH
ncbi:MAG: hypothetical protein AAF368_04465, partial [Planctomycetota bacterium]